MQSKEQHDRFVIRISWVTIVVLMVASVTIPKGEEVMVINGNHTFFQDELFKLLTRLGEGWFFIPVLIWSFFIRYSLAISIVAMNALVGIVCALAKRVLFSDSFLRPAALIDHQLLYFVPGVEVHTHHSFPSGHTATIFCFAILASLMIRHRTATVTLLILALAVGYSRIYLLQHFLLDVTAGAIIGVSSAFLILYIFDRIALPPGRFTIVKRRRHSIANV